MRRLLSNAPTVPCPSYYELGRAQQINWSSAETGVPSARETNPLQEFFASRTEGRGIWKWLHYFDIYHRHFAKFRGRPVHVLEIGVYSGGSLDMWKSYFGPAASIYGVDLQPSCEIYSDDRTRIYIGDQADRDFWARFKHDVPQIDIVIDDGGHEPEQQRITFEELVPHLRPGGVFLCEDVQGANNRFASYVHGVASHLNEEIEKSEDLHDRERRAVVTTSPLQRAIASVHLYPFVTVVERTCEEKTELVTAMHGTQWQPY